MSSTDPSAHPHECWYSSTSNPPARNTRQSDVWAGGSIHVPILTPTPSPSPPPLPSPPPPPPGQGAGTGATIQPLSQWWYDSPTASTLLLRELTDQSVVLLRNRSNAVAALTGPAAWAARIKTARAKLEKVFAPLPAAAPRAPPTFKVVSTLRRPTYTVSKILYETRPGFYAPAALWKPTGNGNGNGGAEKYPGVLLVSGHTPDGWRSNNLFGDVKNNAPGDDDYEVVQINLVARGFVVLAFDPIGQGERMQYADVPQGKPDPTAPWSHGANGSFLWGSTADHEYMGQWLCEFSGGGAS